MKIPYVNLSAQWHDERTELLPLIESVLAGGNYVGGKDIERFEQIPKQFLKSELTPLAPQPQDIDQMCTHFAKNEIDYEVV